MIPKSATFDFYAGDTQSINGQLLDALQQGINISGDSDRIIFTARKTPRSPVIVRKQAVKVVPTIGSFSIQFDASDFVDVAFDKVTPIVFDILHISGSRHRTFVSGTINVYPRVNNEPEPN